MNDYDLADRDWVSRQAAIDAMCELMHHWFGGDPKDEIREIKRELEKLPSAQPERNTGKWIFIGDGYKCSKCRSVYSWWADSQTSNYCPNCGADMREGEADG